LASTFPLKGEFTMSDRPASVTAFLAGKRIAVAGVSRDPKGHVGNAILKKFAASGYETFAVNPNATEIEGATCYPAIGAIPGDIDGVVIATHPAMAATVVRQCADKGVRHIWFHRSFGQGSVSPEALDAAKSAGIETIASGCPMMFLEPVDGGHKFICRLLQFFGKVPR
jgi:predicted CoA-binding protein